METGYDRGETGPSRGQRARSILSTGWREYRQALCLLTRLPVRVEWAPDLKWGQLAGLYPAVGLTIGLALALTAWLWGLIAEPYPLITAALVLALWAGLTGALHLDGWGDCMDAFFTPVSRERRLEIMADPRLGGFGTTGLVLLLLVKYGGAAYVVTLAIGIPGFGWPLETLWLLVVAPVAARAVLVAVLADARLPLAKPDGMGAKAREGLEARQVGTAVATAAVVAVLGGYRGVAMFLAAAAAGLSFAYFAKRRIGGITGDVLGAVVEIAETAALLAASLKV